MTVDHDQEADRTPDAIARGRAVIRQLAALLGRQEARRWIDATSRSTESPDNFKKENCT